MKSIQLISTVLLIQFVFGFIPTKLFAQQSEWTTNQDGWVLRKAPGSDKSEKFFAIGLWNIPGFTAMAMEEDPVSYRESAKPYLDKSPLYNLVYMAPGKTEYLRHRVEVSGSISFQETLKKYLDEIPGLNQGNDREYARRQYAKKHVQDKLFENMLDSAVNHTHELNGNTDHIWAPIDEIVNGGAGSGWCWHPAVGAKIYDQIKKKEKNSLVYTDLVGIGRGNTFLFE